MRNTLQRNILQRNILQRNILQRILAFTLAAVIAAGAGAAPLAAESTAAGAAADKAMKDTAALMLTAVKNPVVDSVGGEWAVIGLARSGYPVPPSYYEGYYQTVKRYVTEKKGVLHDVKYTEYSRVVLALTAAGFDPRDVGGYDLTLPLGDFEKTVWQGINGPAFALIAFDSAGYEIPENPEAKTQATRDLYIAEILSRQLPGGGFALSKSGGVSDPDVTGIVLQALANYQDRAGVKSATEKALAYLSAIQDEKGGFSSWSAESSESVVQAIVALCGLQISTGDSRFTKNGNSLLDRLMDYYVPGKGFEHIIGGGVDQMATEQALYALAAISRFERGQAALYDMTDSGISAAPERPSAPGLPGKAEDVRQLPVTEPGKTFSDIAGETKTAVEALASRGIISGYGGGVFKPEERMSRAQFASAVTRALGLERGAAPPFTDIPPGSWYEECVAVAFHYGIIAGKTPEQFDPEGYITKLEAAVMTARAAKLCGMDTAREPLAVRDMLAQFPDYTAVPDYGREALAFCYDSGILSQSDMTVEAGRLITRGEIAGMLYRMLDKAALL